MTFAPRKVRKTAIGQGKKQLPGEGASEEAGLPSSFKEQPLSVVGVELQATPKSVSTQGGLAPQGEPTAKWMQKEEKEAEVVEPTPPAVDMESPDITPKEESLMLEALIAYEKEAEEEAKK